MEKLTTNDNQEDIYNHVSKYTNSNWIYSITYLLLTLIPLYLCFQFVSIFIIPLLSLLLVRTFIIYHDLSHGIFFPNKFLNKFFAIFLGMLVFTPYSYWNEEHTKHHKTSNNLDIEEQYTKTAPWERKMYESKNFTERILYKIKFGWYTLYSIMPYALFIFIHHIKSNIYENILHLLYLIFLYYYLTPLQYIYIYISYWLGAIIGFLIFHSQHTYDGVYKEHTQKWDRFKSGLYGASFLQVPYLLKFFTCNVQYHHIHHLNSKIPCYNLQKCHDDKIELFNDVSRVTLNDVFRTIHYSLYDYNSKTYLNVYDL